jgi:hypothetical protein
VAVPSQPPNDPGAFRHLGRTERSGSGLAIAGLVALLILVAVPLYLWRRPKPALPVETARAEIDAGAPDAAAALLPMAPQKAEPKLTLTDAKVIQCGARSGRWTKDRCDELPAIGDALARAIRENVACAPISVTPNTVSFVLKLDFDRKKTHLWAGRSGTLRRRAAADLIKCVEHAMPKIDWPATAHQFMRYELNVVASYPAAPSAPAAAPSAISPHSANLPLGAP